MTTMTKKPTPEQISAVMSEFGRRGGSAAGKSERKTAAAKKSLELARQKRWPKKENEPT
jgi:hypothetical protein